MSFVKPPLELYLNDSLGNLHYRGSSHTYSEYNYLGDGLAARIKSRHFEIALELVAPYFGQANVIDFGCADGVLLPSLSQYFPRVAGIDIRSDFMQISEYVIEQLDLSNVQLICNKGLEMAELKLRLKEHTYSIAFLLEVVEHVGDRDDPWKSRVDFIEEVATLLEPQGLLVVSIPKMVGFPYLFQRIGLQLMGAQWESIKTADFLRAVLFNDTTNLEPRWDGGHLGFNHLKLEAVMGSRFRILKRTGSYFTMVYLLQKIS